MALHFLHGETPYGSPDHQVAWFAALEDFLVNTVGWTVASGAGTTDIVFTSIGESGLLTMLFVHIWAVGVLVHGEVQDDLAGTHTTTTNSPLGVPLTQQVEYWITADLDTIVIVVPYQWTERVKYLGLLSPLALNPVDETYYMVASRNNLSQCGLLRNHTGLWGVNMLNYGTTLGSAISVCPLSDEFSPFAFYANRYDDCAGQYKFLSAGLGDYAMKARDKVTSGIGAATSEWEVFHHGTGVFMLQTAGAAPGDSPDGAHFAYQTGVEPNEVGFLTVTLPAFMTAIGWTDLGSPGLYTTDRLFHSTGEDGQRDIYILVGLAVGPNPYWHIHAYDDALFTHGTGNAPTLYAAANWPGTYHIAADRDCLCMAWEDSLWNTEPMQWVGMCEPTYPGIADSNYLTGAYAEFSFALTAYVLRNMQGNWGLGVQIYDAGEIGDASSPSLFDGTTYSLWPYSMSSALPGAGTPRGPAGWMKYAMHIDGAPLAVGDTITVGAEQYLVMRRVNSPPLFWAMRIL